MKRKNRIRLYAKATLFGAAFFIAVGIVGKIDSNTENGYTTTIASAYGNRIYTNDGNIYEVDHDISDGSEKKVIVTFDSRGTSDPTDDVIVDIY
jgi:hypothetical protein